MIKESIFSTPIHDSCGIKMIDGSLVATSTPSIPETCKSTIERMINQLPGKTKSKQNVDS